MERIFYRAAAAAAALVEYKNILFRSFLNWDCEIEVRLIYITGCIVNDSLVSSSSG